MSRELFINRVDTNVVEVTKVIGNCAGYFTEAAMPEPRVPEGCAVAKITEEVFKR